MERRTPKDARAVSYVYLRRRGSWSPANECRQQSSAIFPAIRDFLEDSDGLDGRNYRFSCSHLGRCWKITALLDGDICTCSCEQVGPDEMYAEPGTRVGGLWGEQGMSILFELQDGYRAVSFTPLLRKLFFAEDEDGLMESMRSRAVRYGAEDIVQNCVERCVPLSVFERFRLNDRTLYSRLSLLPMLHENQPPRCVMYVQLLDKERFWQLHAMPDNYYNCFEKIGLVSCDCSTGKFSAQNEAARLLLGSGFNLRVLETNDAVRHALNAEFSIGLIDLQLGESCRQFRYTLLSGPQRGSKLMLLVPSTEENGCTDLLSSLSPQEKRVALLAKNGVTTDALAMTLQVSASTVKKTLTSIYRKLGVNGRVELATLLPSQLDGD